MNEIVHICVPEKFIPPFISLVRENFDLKSHIFLIGKPAAWLPEQPNNIINNSGIIRKIKNLVYLYNAKKILLHGLYDSQIIYLLWLQPWLLKKCYWLIWGDDLYQYLTPPRIIRRKTKEAIRASIIRKFGHIVTYIKGDYELAKKWYGAKGKYHECLLYESNTFQQHPNTPTHNDGIVRVLVGNSAYPRNNHIDALKQISACQSESILIYAPLSYGPVSEAKRVTECGVSLFGERFTPITNFLPIEQYNELLWNIDIGVFNQKRQQAMGNMIAILGMGKTLYIKNGTTSWELFSSLGFALKDIKEFDATVLDIKETSANIDLVKKYFSKQLLVAQYKNIFSGS